MRESFYNTLTNCNRLQFQRQSKSPFKPPVAQLYDLANSIIQPSNQRHNERTPRCSTAVIRFKDVLFDQISFEQFKLSANFSNLCAEIYKAIYLLKVKFEIFHVSKKLNNFKALKVNSLTPYNSITLLFFGFIQFILKNIDHKDKLK